MIVQYNFLIIKNKGNEMEEMTKMVINRANAMLKNPEINGIYQSKQTKEEAQEWLIKVAIASLVIPVSERKNYKSSTRE